MPVASIGAVKPTKPSACQGHAVPLSVTLRVVLVAGISTQFGGSDGHRQVVQSQ